MISVLSIARRLALTRGIWPDLARATFELAIARWRLGRHSGRDILQAARGRNPTRSKSCASAGSILDRVAFAVPRVAARVPWRADCLVQALAAQAWLARQGVTSEVHIGVRKDQMSGFEAHAWLRAGDQTVTGGDFSRFVPIVTPDTKL